MKRFLIASSLILSPLSYGSEVSVQAKACEEAEKTHKCPQCLHEHEEKHPSYIENLLVLLQSKDAKNHRTAIIALGKSLNDQKYREVFQERAEEFIAVGLVTKLLTFLGNFCSFVEEDPLALEVFRNLALLSHPGKLAIASQEGAQYLKRLCREGAAKFNDKYNWMKIYDDKKEEYKEKLALYKAKKQQVLSILKALVFGDQLEEIEDCLPKYIPCFTEELDSPIKEAKEEGLEVLARLSMDPENIPSIRKHALMNSLHNHLRSGSENAAIILSQLERYPDVGDRHLATEVGARHFLGEIT